LLGLSWLMSLTRPLFWLLGDPMSGRDLVLLVGGLFLIGKAAHEIYEKVEGEPAGDPAGPARATATATATAASAAAAVMAAPVGAGFAITLVQILALDIVFSLDSVITAVGMVDELWVMIVAVVVSVLIMMAAAGPISEFVNRHPTVKILALSFLLLIGVSLLLEGFDQHIPKGYIYFAMGFALFVEIINLRARVKRPGV
jgi:predicted tellurium resistance membrane protein TerC